MAAAAKVFSTFELHEAILFELGTRDLLFAQRVSKEWHILIKNSNKIQRALFLKALLSRALDISEAEKQYGTLVKNPLLEPIFELLQDMEFVGVESVARRLSNEDIIHQSWDAPGASWRRMLPTQPATSGVLSVNMMADDPEDGSEVEKEQACSRSSIRMGQILAEIDKIIPRLHSSDEFELADPYTTIQTGDLDDYQALESNQQLEEMIRHAARNNKELHRTEEEEEPTSDDKSNHEDETDSEGEARTDDSLRSDIESMSDAPSEDSEYESDEGSE